MSRPLYTTDVIDLTAITPQQLDQLRVKNINDEYTRMKHIHQITSSLNLSALDTREEITKYRAEYTNNYNQLSLIAKDFKTYIMYVFRWRARGLSCDQAITKAILDSKRRSAWNKTQNAYWYKK